MSSFQLNLNPLKEPLGFIKVLEWVSAARAPRAGSRAAAPAPVPARPAPSAGRLGALGAGARLAPRRGAKPPSSPRRDRTGLEARGGDGRPRPGPARGGDAAVGVKSRVPRLPPSHAEPPSHTEAHLWVSLGEWWFKFLFGFTASRKGRENFLLRSNRNPAGRSSTPAGAASAPPVEPVHFCPVRTGGRAPSKAGVPSPSDLTSSRVLI